MSRFIQHSPSTIIGRAKRTTIADTSESKQREIADFIRAQPAARAMDVAFSCGVLESQVRRVRARMRKGEL